MDETVILGKYKKFLKNMPKKYENLQIDTVDTYLNTYITLQKDLKKLQEMRDNMELKGFKAPYRSIQRYGANTASDLKYEDRAESSRHNQLFHIHASAKKNLLDRFKSAIASHKIAIGNLNEYGSLQCKKCHKKYKSFEINIDTPQCTCGGEFELIINPSSCCRPEIIEYLPLSGDYMVILNELGNTARQSFKTIINTLKKERKGVVKTVTLVIRLMENGRWIRKRVNLGSEYVDKYEEEIRKQYGKNVRIEFLQFRRIKPTVINDKHTRTALGLAYAKYSETITESLKKNIAHDHIQNIKQLQLYDNLKNKIKYSKPRFYTNENLDQWREIRLKEELDKKGLIDENGEIIKSLQQDIETREEIEKSVFSKIAPTLLIWDILKYYLTTHPDKRTQNIGPFPYLQSVLDRNQIQVFGDLDKKTTKALRNNKCEKILYLVNMQELLLDKFKLEEEMRGLHMKIDYPAFGAAIIHLNADIPIEHCANAFSTDIPSVQRELDNIEHIKHPKTNKSKKFLEMLTN